jgi:hypothetical protein
MIFLMIKFYGFILMKLVSNHDVYSFHIISEITDYLWFNEELCFLQVYCMYTILSRVLCTEVMASKFKLVTTKNLRNIFLEDSTIPL